MINRRILKLSVSIIAFLVILGGQSVLANPPNPPITSLPICGNAEGTKAPDSTAATCTNGITGDAIAATNYCINAEKTKLYKTVDTTCVPHAATLTAGYYVFSCTTANICTFVDNTSAALGALTHGDENLVVYQYDSGTGQLTQIKNNSFYYSFNTNVNRLIECPKGDDFISSNGKCSIVASGVYINPGTDSTASPASNPLIKVASSVATASAATITHAISGAKSYYLDESSKIGTSTSYAKLIECSSTTSCQSVNPIPGTFLDEGSLDTQGKYINIITCTEASCSSAAVTTGIYINSAVSGSVAKALINYDGTNKLQAFDGVAGEYYLHGDDDYLIECTSNGCAKKEASTTGVYLDKGTYDGGYTNVIQCTSSTTCKSDNKVTLADGTNPNLAIGNIFLNAAVTSGKAKAIIACTEGVKCDAVATPTEGYYVHTIHKGTHVIHCTSSGCVPEEGKRGTAYGYKDANDATNKSIITFDSDEYKSVDGTASGDTPNKYYINAVDTTKIIECLGGNGVCSDKSYSITGKYEFFDHGDIIITCSSSGCVASKGLQYCKDTTANAGCKKISGGSDLTADSLCISTDGKIYITTDGEYTPTRKRAIDHCTDIQIGDGVHVFKSASDPNTEGTLGSDDGYLYDCSNHVCTQILGLGYYEAGKALYTVGDDDVFTKATLEATTLKYYLTKNDELIKCTSDTVSTCLTQTITDGYFVNAAANTMTNGIIKCSGSSCELKDAADGEFYLNQGADKDDETEASRKPLISCTTDLKCATAAATATGNYNDAGDSSKIINCSTQYACTNPAAVEGAYLSATDGEIISCVKGDGNVITCSASAAHGGIDTAPVYYLEANSDSTKRKIYRCVATGNCSLVTQPVNGIYLNKADSTNQSYISCDGSVCEIKATTETCTKAADVITSGSDLKLCIVNDDANAETLVSDTTSEKSYLTLTLSSASDIKNNTKTKVTFIIDNEGRAFLAQDHKLPICVAGANGTCSSASKYCIDSSGKIKVGDGDNNTCNAITIATVFGSITDAGVYAAYFTVEFEVKLVADAAQASMAYLCTFSDANTMVSCEWVKGYTKISSDNIYCSGWKGDYCGKTTTASCADSNNKIGEYSGATDGLCFKTGGEVLDQSKVALPGAGTTNNIIFYSEDINAYYGVEASTYVSLYLTSTSATVTKDTSFISGVEGYQINRSVVGTLANALLKCSGTSCSVITAKPGYYFNGDKDKDTNNLIKCDATSGCVKEAGNTDGNYYIDAENNDTKIILCAKATAQSPVTCSSIAHGGTDQAPKHYLSNATDKLVITCTSTGCFFENTEVKGYFLNGAGTSGKSLIKCVGTPTLCSVIDDVDNYDSSNGFVGSVKVADGVVKMCVAVGCSGAGEVEIKSANANASPIYKTVKIDHAVFPGYDFRGTEGEAFNDILVKFANDGSVILLEEITIDYDTKIKSIPEIKRDTAGREVIFVRESTPTFEQVEAPTSSTSPTEDIIAYQCTYALSDNKDNNEQSLNTLQGDCTRVIGYVTLPNGLMVQCNGWRRDGCTVVPSSSMKACASENEGNLGTGKKICLGANAVSLPSSSAAKPSYIAFQTKGLNPYYQKKASDIVYLELTSSSAIAIVPPAITLGTMVTDAKIIVKVEDEFKLFTYTAGAYDVDESSNDVYIFEEVSKDQTYIHFTALPSAPTSTTVLFECYGGTCRQTKGSLLVDTKMYSNESGTWTDVTSNAITTCTDAANEGKIKINGSSLELCHKANEALVKDSGIFFLGANYKMYKLGGGIVANPTPKNGYYYLKDDKMETTTTTGAVLLECNTGACSLVQNPNGPYYSNAEGTKLIKCVTTTGAEATTTCTLINTTGYYVDVNKSLVYCSTNCAIIDSIGYFKTGENYIQCGPKGCTIEALPEANAVKCTTDIEIGKLDDTAKLCLKPDSDAAKIKSGATGKYIISYSSSSIFKGFVSNNNYFGLIDVNTTDGILKLLFDNSDSLLCVKSDEMKVEADLTSCGTAGYEYFMCNVDGVCLPASSEMELPESVRNQKKVEDEEEEKENTSASDLKIECEVLNNGNNCKEKTYYLIDKSDNYHVLEDGIGSLYYCTTEGQNCSEIREVGYYVIDESLGYYVCQALSDEISCHKASFGSTCESLNDVGKIIYASNKISLCLNYNEGATIQPSIELNASNSGNYVLPRGNDNVFGLEENQYAIINVKDRIISLNNNYQNKLKYVYANTESNYKIIEKGDTCPKTKTANPTWNLEKIMEMTCDQGKCTDNSSS